MNSRLLLLGMILLSGVLTVKSSQIRQNYLKVDVTTPRFKEGAQFTDLCNNVMRNQKLFTDECGLYPNSALDISIEKILEKTKNATPDSSIDHFLRNELFEGSTDFFRKNHSTNQDYIDKLDDFTTRLEKICDRLKSDKEGTKTVTLLDLIDAFYHSGMQGVTSAEIKIKNYKLADANLTDAEYFELEKILNCKTGRGVCQRARDVFGFYETDKWRPLTLDEALNKIVENSFEYFGIAQVFKDREELKKFLKKLSEKGTSLPVSELQTIINTNKLFDLMVKSLNDENFIGVTTTTAPPIVTDKQNTTEKPVYGQAVSDLVAYGVPSALVLVGILACLLLVAYQIYSKPSINATEDLNVMEMKEKKVPIKLI